MQLLERHLQLGDWFCFSTRKPDNYETIQIEDGSEDGRPLLKGSHILRAISRLCPQTPPLLPNISLVSSTFIELSTLTLRMVFCWVPTWCQPLSLPYLVQSLQWLCRRALLSSYSVNRSLHLSRDQLTKLNLSANLSSTMNVSGRRTGFHYLGGRPAPLRKK